MDATFARAGSGTGRRGLHALRRWREANRNDPAQRAATLRRVDRLAWLLDGAFAIPALNRRIGLDAILGAIPVAGDAIGAALAGWIVVEAWRIGAPPRLLARMLANIAIDTGLGAVPIAGDIFDVVWASNRRNAALLRDWLATVP
ncbi:MAG: DUF4112 domain-containing protein [Alphaproteobacteria bacterium]|nr:DUF4112 domain-containing protein [Alphaproteobacteria bacterium]